MLGEGTAGCLTTLAKRNPRHASPNHGIQETLRLALLDRANRGRDLLTPSVDRWRTPRASGVPRRRPATLPEGRNPLDPSGTHGPEGDKKRVTKKGDSDEKS